jgi:hypothetical protein
MLSSTLEYPFVLLLACLSLFAPSQVEGQFTVSATAARACVGRPQVTLTALQSSAPLQVDWRLTPAFAGTLSPANGTSSTFTVNIDKTNSAAVEGLLKVIAKHGASDSVVYPLYVSALCTPNYGGDLTRITVGFEQIGASGIESTQKYAFDFFIDRPIPTSAVTNAASAAAYLGPPLKWWGEVRIGSYPQQVSTEAASFATGFVTNAGKLPVNRLVQTAEFTTGPELRLLGSASAAHPLIGSSLERFALTVFGGVGAVGPFPLVSDSLPVFLVPDPATAQGKAFARGIAKIASDESLHVSTTYVAFRPEAPDRFLLNWSLGLRLYTFYASETGEPLQTAPATVSIAWGRNDMIAGRRGSAFHVSAYYPFALGDRADPASLILYLFGDAWMTARPAKFSAPDYQLEVAHDAAGKSIPASNSAVTIVPVLDEPRDTYRLGVSIDLLKLWERLTASSTTSRPASPAADKTGTPGSSNR